MKNLYLIGIILIAFKIAIAQSDASQYNLALNNLDTRGEVYFSFHLDDLSLLNDLTNRISLDNVKGNTVFAYANRKEFVDFLSLGLTYETLTAPSLLNTALMTDDPKQVLTWDYYPTYTAYESIMQQFASDHPSICKLITITTLASGRKILALRISDNVNIQENEPEFLYSSSIHGDETTGYILMLHLADYLLSGYGSDSRITNMVNSTDIVICPLANPDGTYKGGNNSVNGATRFNANNIDLNRNYPDPRAGSHPDGNAWQPETIAFMNFTGENSFTMGSNFHGGEEVLNYPWDTWTKLTADNNWWVYTSRQYADTVHLHAPAGYLDFMNNGITNGAVWYIITGGMQDYMNFFRFCRESTLEISDVKLLPASQLVAHWNYNYRSLLNYIEQSNYGLNGIVTDSITGQPLRAKVFIQGFDKDSSYVYTDPQVGDYNRLLKAGTYNVTFTASGYYPKTYQFQVADMQTIIQNVQLYDGRLATNFSADFTQVAVDQQVHFTDKSVGQPQSWSWSFEGGTPSASSETNPIVTYQQPGFYSVKLVISRAGSTDSLVRNQYIEVKPWYLMGNKTYSVCDGKFCDTGGPLSPYGVYESNILTFLPQQPTHKVKAVFNSMDIEAGGSGCNTDVLLVYDGSSATGNPLATLCGNTIPASIIASNPAGALTFKFSSDGSNSLSGWDVTLSCFSNLSVGENIENEIRIFPNPVINNKFVIESVQPILNIVIRDITGRIVHKLAPISNKVVVDSNWPSGIYIIQLQFHEKWINKKIHVIAN
jgi:PKD repeat protein